MDSPILYVCLGVAYGSLTALAIETRARRERQEEYNRKVQKKHNPQPQAERNHTMKETICTPQVGYYCRTEEERSCKVQEHYNRRVQEKINRTTQEENNRTAQEEKNRLMQQEKIRRAHEEKNRLIQEENIRRAHEEKNRLIQEENIRTAHEEKNRLIQQEKDLRAQEEKSRLIQHKKDRRAQEEKDRLIKQEKKRIAQEKYNCMLRAQEEKKRIAQEKYNRMLQAQEERKQIAQQETKRIAQEERKQMAQEETKRIAQEEMNRIEQEENSCRAHKEMNRKAQEKKEQEETSREPGKEPPPPMVLVPPLFDSPPLAARTRMLESSYDMLFGKLALKCLFNDYFEETRHFSTRIMLKPIDDPNVDLTATVIGPLGSMTEESINGNAMFRWQRDLDDPNTFMDLFVSSSDASMRMRSCVYYPKIGIGAFGIFPILTKNGVSSGDSSVMGLRYGGESLSFGATFMPFSHQSPKNAWLVSKIGRLTAGVQYTPIFGSNSSADYKDLANWSCAIGYGLGSTSPLSPSFNFSLELVRSSQVIASFYQHIVIQRPVKNPSDNKDTVVGITNYLDVGFEFERRTNGAESLNKSTAECGFRLAASWQANKNFLLKGKLGPISSSLALAVKSWLKPSFTFNISAVHDHKRGKTAFGFGLRMEDLREARYQRAEPNHVMLTPNKEHLVEGVQWKTMGNTRMLQTDVDSRPVEEIL